MNGKNVIKIFPETGIAALAFPPDLSDSVTRLYRGKGVEVLTGKTVEGLVEDRDRLVLQVPGNQSITVDAVVPVGEFDPRLQIVSKWKEPYREGIRVLPAPGHDTRRPAVKCMGQGGECPRPHNGRARFQEVELDSAIPM